MLACTIRWLPIVLLAFAYHSSVGADYDSVDKRVEAAEALLRERGPDEALPVLEELAAEFRASGKALDEAVTLTPDICCDARRPVSI